MRLKNRTKYNNFLRKLARKLDRRPSKTTCCPEM